MKRDPLQVLGRIRSAAVTEAQRGLTAALAAEAQCRSKHNTAHETLRSEQACAGTADTVAFAAWMPVARDRIARAEAALAESAADVARCQARVTARRADAEAVASVQRTRAAELLLVQQRRDQAVLDDAGAQMLRRTRERMGARQDGSGQLA